VAERLSLALMEPPLDWLTTVPSPFLRRSVRFTTLREAREETGPAFIKPADDKCFPAQVYASGAALPTPEGVPETTPVLIAQPVVWEAEFRCFVREGAVTTLSPYWRTTGLAQAEDGSWPAAPEETEEASAFAAAVLERVPMPPGVVLDIGRIAGQGWAVVEANPAWASGLYGCDPAAVLPVLRRAATPRNPLLQQDLRWTVDRADNSTG
jgi:hypothetical protein